MCLAVVALLSAAVAATASGPITVAGEMRRSITTASAAVRNHGDGGLRVLVWYPAIGTEREVDIGPPAHPIFLTGAVATDAPFADHLRHPLILMSHGFGGVARQLAWLGEPLARRGYVVVAVDHPGTNGRDGVTAEGTAAPWERAGDLEAALNLVLADPGIASHIDARRIGVAGFSIGGFTSLLLAGARPDFDALLRFCAGPGRDAICDPQLEYAASPQQNAALLATPGMRAIAARRHGDFRDRRVKAVLAIAPAVGQALDPASLVAIDVPVDIVLGDADPVAPPRTNGDYIAGLIRGARLTVLPGVRHYDFLSICGPFSAKVASAYCTDAAGVDREQTHARALAEARDFFDRTLGR
jgi:predicted dienelactone hydrolase